MGNIGFRAATAALLLAGIATVPIGGAAAQSRPQESARTPSVPPLAYRVRKLRNGLTVYAMRDTSTPNVMTSLWYEVGSKHNPIGRAGFAHLFEHLLSRKTINIPYDMLNTIVEGMGGDRNATTSHDRTNYYETVPAQNLEAMLWTHAERMARPVLDQHVLDTERKNVGEELRERTLAPPYQRLYSIMLFDNLFDTPAFKRSGIGNMAELGQASVADALAFHQAYYGPDTATLIVSGNFDDAQLDALVDKHFAGIPRRPRPMSLKLQGQERPLTQPRLVDEYAPNVPLPVVLTAWRTPPSSHRDNAALTVASAILSLGNNSRLYRNLIEDEALASSAFAALWPFEEVGAFMVSATLASGKAIEEAEAAVAAEMSRLREATVTAEELAEAKTQLIADTLRGRETFTGRATELGDAVVRTGDPRAADRLVADIQKVTAADVQRVARTYLADNSRLVIRYRDEKLRPGAQVAGAHERRPDAYVALPPAARPANRPADDASRQPPPSPGAAPTVTAPAVAEHRLVNGLSVVTARTGNIPLGTVALMVKGGSSTDPANLAGLSRLTANLLNTGTTTRSARQIAAELEALGARISSSTDPDGMILTVSAPVANLEAAGRLLADIAQNATFPEEELERDRRRELDGLAVALRNPSQLASLLAQPLLYGDSPYGAIPTGTATSLKRIARADIERNYRQWWRPSNAALIIAGGLDPAAAKALAERLFGGWRAEGSAPPLPADPAGQAVAPRTLVIDMPTAGQAAVMVGLRGIGRGDPDYYNLMAANAVLGIGSTSRLFREIRLTRSLSYGPGSSMSSRLDEGLLFASVPTRSENVDEVVKIVLAELDRLGSTPFEKDQLDKRGAFLGNIFSRQGETSTGFASLVAGLIRQGVAPAEATRLAQAFRTVSPEAAAKAVQRLVSADRASLVIVGDASKFIDDLRAVRPNVEVIKFDQLDLDAPVLRRPS
jgi:zinc protease